MSAQISKDCTRPLVMSEDETKEKIAELVGLNKSTNPFASYKEINMELAKPDVSVCIETLLSYADRLDFKSYIAAHKPKSTARHRKSRLRWAKEHLNWTEDQWRNIVWSYELRFCMESSKRGKRYPQSSGGWNGAMVWEGGFEPLEIIEAGSVDQETYINILTNRLHPWFTNVTLHQERDFIFQEDGASCHTGGYARW
ncbi:hypothetical protein G6F37_012279 [Rhizopus arrhizus]|nr:hypothetical protein G6F38_012309 [Rhizopus arrhizus]KAG1144567.1 hypothetical protein G6F37_012279 [Rhizopus arrhizus]